MLQPLYQAWELQRCSHIRSQTDLNLSVQFGVPSTMSSHAQGAMRGLGGGSAGEGRASLLAQVWAEQPAKTYHHGL